MTDPLCPKCGGVLATYYCEATGEEFYCEHCAPRCPLCAKKMVTCNDPEAKPACLDCVFWGLVDEEMVA